MPFPTCFMYIQEFSVLYLVLLRVSKYVHWRCFSANNGYVCTATKAHPESLRYSLDRSEALEQNWKLPMMISNRLTKNLRPQIFLLVFRFLVSLQISLNVIKRFKRGTILRKIGPCEAQSYFFLFLFLGFHVQ